MQRSSYADTHTHWRAKSMLSVMCTTEENGVYYGADQIEDLHGLGDLFTPQELPFLDSFGQEFDSLEQAAVGEAPVGHGSQGLQGQVATGGDSNVPRQRPPLGKSRRSNPFYSPSRQIVNLVQKKKLSKTLKRESSAPLMTAVSMSQLQTQQVTPPELQGCNGKFDAGSSDNTRNK